MKITGKLNKISDGQYGVGILVSGHEGFINTKDSLKAVLANVSEGDFVEVDAQVVNKNGKTYYNFTADKLRRGNASAAPAAGTKTSSTDKVDGAVRGMAFNNAIQTAISAGRLNDDEFIINQTIRFYKLQATIEARLNETPKAAPVAQEQAVADALDGLEFGEAA